MLRPKLRFAAYVTLALLASSGCRDVNRRHGPGATCSADADCRTPYVCALGACRAECERDSDCAEGACLLTMDGRKTCTVSAEQSCVVGADEGCADGFVCGSDHVCRNPCDAADACSLPSQLCYRGACFNDLPAEGDGDGAAPGASGDASGGEPSMSGAGAPTRGGTAGAGGNGSAGKAGAASSGSGGGMSGGAAGSAGSGTVDSGGGGSAGSGGAPGCSGLDPEYSLVEGFETAALVDVSAPWVRYSQSRTGAVNKTWPHSGKNALEVTSFSTSTEIDYLPLGLPDGLGHLVIELQLAPDGFFVYKDFASFGVGFAESKFSFSPVLTLKVTDHTMTAKSDAFGEQSIWTEVDYSADGPVYNYVRLEFSLCDHLVAVYAGADANAPLRQTVPLPSDASFNALYVSGGVNPTHFDDIVAYTPGTQVDRSALETQGAKVISSFDSPGSSCTALAWDGSALWYFDNIGRLYQLGTSGNVLKTIEIPGIAAASDLAWDGSNLWALDVDYSTGDLVKLDASGAELKRVGPVSTWAWSGLAWDGKYFWVGDYNSWIVRKYDISGKQILNWGAASFDHPRGMAATPDGVWYAAGDQLYQQSFVGETLGFIQLADLGLSSAGNCLEWDGSHLWYSVGFKVYEIALAP